jgi:hypothetical protein
MLTDKEAQELGQQWIQLWNENDFDRYLLLYDDQAREISSISLRLIDATSGQLNGKNTLYNYWTILKTKFPSLQYFIERIITDHQNIWVYFKIPTLESKAIARLDLSPEHKITKVCISHV